MRTARPAGGAIGAHVLDGQQAGPMVSRMLVGAELRRLREASGITRDAAGYAIRSSESKISRLELGRIGFKPRDVADLLTLYGVSAEAERATLLALAEEANRPPWWQPYRDVLPTWFESFLGLEQAARVIRTYEVQFVPGLLQTADYARAVIRLGHDNPADDDIERRVELRMRRQRILHEPDGPKLWAVVDEAALRRLCGGVTTMREQLAHLIAMAELRNITIQVMPFSRGGHAAAGGPITILRLPEGDLPDVVFLEQLASAVYLDKPADTEHYWHVMNELSITAASPAASVELLRRIRGELG